MKALLHAHSTYSYDGTSTLAELAAWGDARGLDFILLAEHTNDFDAAKMERFVRDVDSLNGGKCRLVPGLEFSVRGGFHLLGFNVRRWREVVEPAAAAGFTREQGGLAVLAHPSRYRGRWPDAETMRALHGIEVWNARYDGRFLPSAEVLSASKTMSAEFAGIRFLGGQDLHEISPARLVVTVAAGPPHLESLLQAIAEGRARFGAPGLWFDANRGPSFLSMAFLKYGHRSYRLARKLRDQRSP